MKKIFLQSWLVLLFLVALGITAYALPLVWQILGDTSFKFVGLFLVLILSSNILAKIAVKFITS